MLSKSEVGRWLSDPVTQVVIDCLKEVDLDIAESCGRGGAIPQEGQNRTMEQLYFEAQGALDTIQLFTLYDRPFMKLLDSMGKLAEEDDE